MAAKAFRSSFVFPNRDQLSWFPGHMMRGMNKMQHVLKYVDCLFEVHDARIPFTGRNKTFKHRIGIKPRILLLCKSDLALWNSRQRNVIKEQLMAEEDYKDVLFCNAKMDKDPVLKGLVARSIEVVNNEDRYNREFVPDYRLMVCGIPNVGKSSIINALRRIYMARKKHKVAEEGARPGVTRALMERVKIVDYPPVFLYDTPGILPPSISCIDTGMKLAIFDYVKPSLENECIADYLLYQLNSYEVFNYVKFFGLKEPTDNIGDLLTKIAEDGHMLISSGSYLRRYDWSGASLRFLSQFRKGYLGKIPFDEVKPKTNVREYEVNETYFLGNIEVQSELNDSGDEVTTSNEQSKEDKRRLIGDVTNLISSTG